VADLGSNLRQDITSMPDAGPLFGSVASEVMRYLASFAMTAVATVVAVGVDSTVTIPNLSLVFVVPVIIAGVSLGLGPSLCSAILGALAFNFFLTEPRYSLAVDDPANIWAIGLLFVIGLIVSGVAFTSQRRATEAALLRRQVSVLQGYSRDLVAADNTKAIVSITSSRCSSFRSGIPLRYRAPAGWPANVIENAICRTELPATKFPVSAKISWTRRLPNYRSPAGDDSCRSWSARPLWVKSRHMQRNSRCPLCARSRHWAAALACTVQGIDSESTIVAH
jgi:hypothetical protein